MGELTSFTEVYDPSDATQLPVLDEGGNAQRWAAHNLRRNLLRVPMDTPYRTMMPFITIGTQTRVPNSIHFTPFFAPVNFQLDALLLSTAQASANAVARAGIFTYNAETHEIGALEQDFGEDDIAAGGAGEWTSIGYKVERGWHALAMGIRGASVSIRMINYTPEVKFVKHNNLTGNAGNFEALSYFETTNATNLATGFTDANGANAAEKHATTGYQTSPFFWKLSYPTLEIPTPEPE